MKITRSVLHWLEKRVLFYIYFLNNDLLFKWNLTGGSVQFSPFHFFSIWNSILAVTSSRRVVEAGTFAWGTFCNQKVFGKWWDQKCWLSPLAKINRTNRLNWRNYLSKFKSTWGLFWFFYRNISKITMSATFLDLCRKIFAITLDKLN